MYTRWENGVQIRIKKERPRHHGEEGSTIDEAREETIEESLGSFSKC